MQDAKLLMCDVWSCKGQCLNSTPHSWTEPSGEFHKCIDDVILGYRGSPGAPQQLFHQPHHLPLLHLHRQTRTHDSPSSAGGVEG